MHFRYTQERTATDNNQSDPSKVSNQFREAIDTLVVYVIYFIVILFV
jgi:hypothetical protein